MRSMGAWSLLAHAHGYEYPGSCGDRGDGAYSCGNAAGVCDEAGDQGEDGPPDLWMTLKAIQRREIGMFGWLVDGNGIRDCAIRTYLVRGR